MFFVVVLVLYLLFLEETPTVVAAYRLALSSCRHRDSFLVVITLKTLRLFLQLLAVLLVLTAVVHSSPVGGRGRGPLLGAFCLPVRCFRGSGAARVLTMPPMPEGWVSHF